MASARKPRSGARRSLVPGRARGSTTPLASAPRWADIVGFASLKGGVGKTTLALMAAECRRHGHAGVPSSPVVLIDADVAGTEVHWVWRRYPLSGVSLVELIGARPSASLATAPMPLEVLKDELKGGSLEGLLVPSFRDGAETDRATIEWKRVLETTTAYATVRFREVLRTLVQGGARVVVDLPAFDVGFAHQLRLAIEAEGGQTFLVSDFDHRSTREVYAYLQVVRGRELADPAFYHHVVYNRVPVGITRDNVASKLSNAGFPVKARTLDRPLVITAQPTLAESTSAGGPAKPRELEGQIGAALSALGAHAADLWRA